MQKPGSKKSCGDIMHRHSEILKWSLPMTGHGLPPKALLDRMQAEVFYPIIQYGRKMRFQKSRILNKAVERCAAEYIVMSDGDCVPRKDFWKFMRNIWRKDIFFRADILCYRCRYPKRSPGKTSKPDVVFDVQWLKANGLKSSFKNNKLTSAGFKARLLNKVTPTGATWNGHNASGWKKDIVAVNGFDERMQYGGQDRELGERLMNYGIRGNRYVTCHMCTPGSCPGI